MARRRRRVRRPNPPPPLILGLAAFGAATLGLILLVAGGSDAMASTARSGPTPPTTPVPAGVYWLQFWPTGKTTATLGWPFRTGVETFITRIEKAGGLVEINATDRPYERAWLMQVAWDIVHGLDPAHAPTYPGINIIWTREGAAAMVKGYSLAVRPVLGSNHIPKPPNTKAFAIDMNITFPRATSIVDANGRAHAIAPGDGNLNPVLHAVGATFGVRKLVKDRPHWSIDAH